MSELQKQLHDIRKPLNNISMQAELVKMLTESAASSDKISDSANKIIVNAKECSNMLQALFEYLEKEKIEQLITETVVPNTEQQQSE